MGVKNLWDILESCKKKLPLQHLQNKKVCVDLSCWLVQMYSANRSPAFAKDKVYLKNLFHRIRALLALNCTLLFVTGNQLFSTSSQSLEGKLKFVCLFVDGAIPCVKLATYRRRLGSNSHAAPDSHPSTSLRRNRGSEFSCMIKEAKRLGMALGIPCLDGLEEAEAQCASLDLESLCDGCFTSDSDAFLFGARTVYRDVFIGEGGYVICYEMEDIEKTLGFGRNSLISLAVLLGSDYSNGVNGFGPETACRLVKSVGENLILDQILSNGVKATRKCKGKNNGNKVDNMCPKASSCEVGMTQDSDGQFRDVINAYLEPKCHSPDSEAVQRVCGQHPFLRPQLQKICKEYFDWSPEKTDQYILPKIAERELRRFSDLRSASSALGIKPLLSEIPVPCPVLAIVKQRKVHRNECYEVSWRNIDGLQVSVVPGDLVRSACPEKITEFLEKKGEEKKQKRRARPKKSGQAAVEDVDERLQELLLGIEADSGGILGGTGNGSAAYAVPVEALDVVDLSSPSPPLRKLSKSQKKMMGVDVQCQSMNMNKMESESSFSTQSSTTSDVDKQVIDLSSPVPAGIRHDRGALADMSNFGSQSKEEEAGGHGGNCVASVIDLSSPSPAIGADDDVIHERKARELRSFLDSIRSELY
uniref:XPG-I domain-containing protein n=1 Tax=Oryza punctata TaxID=4537 RepID=A0A0E0LQA6_ORYPU